MPAKKKTAKKTTRKISSVVESEAMTTEMTADTKTIIVIILLLFIYPIGIIFMWIWMNWWPTWLKVILTIPFALGIIGIILGFTFAGMVFRRAMQQDRYRYDNRMYQVNNQPYRQGVMQQHMMLSPTPTSFSYSNQ